MATPAIDSFTMSDFFIINPTKSVALLWGDPVNRDPCWTRVDDLLTNFVFGYLMRRSVKIIVYSSFEYDSAVFPGMQVTYLT